MAPRNQGRAARILFTSRQYTEDEHGNLVRVWGHPDEDWTRPEDVRAWLRGKRVIEDLASGLEHVRPGYITMLVKDGYLRPDLVADFFWITKKCADRFGLERPKHMPPFPE